MSTSAPFSFDEESTQFRFSQHSPIGLFKLRPGVRTTVVFGSDVKSRLMVPVHWDKSTGKSRRCNGESCADCDLGYVTQFHLYAAVLIQGSPQFKALVDLGTTLAKRWQLKTPDFSVPFAIWRKDKFGTVFAEQQDFKAAMKFHWPGWDIADDINHLFRGRTSPPSMT